jgi:5'-3' exonuclease
VSEADDRGPVVLIDLGSIFWPAWHSTAGKDICEAHDRSIDHIRKISEGYQLIAICCDSPRNFRKAIDPAYKANRELRPISAYEQLARTKRTLERMGLLLWECDGFEADDLVATACRAAVKLDHEVLVCSADKDLTQLVEFGVQWSSPMTGELLDRDGVRKKFGVWPEQMRDYLAIVGDQSDNIPGVQGVGPKGAAKLLTAYATIEQVMDAVRTNPGKVATPVVSAALQAALAWLPTTIQLVTLRFDAPISFRQIYETRTPKEDPVHENREPSESDRPEHEQETPEPQSEASPGEAGKPDRAEAQSPDRSQAIVAAPSWELGLEPTSLGAAFKLAQGLHGSGLYAKFKNPAAIWAVIIRGRELGLGALTALDCFNIVEGRPCPTAHFLISRARAHRDCDYLEFVDGDETFAEWRGKAKGQKEVTIRYTIEQAKDAGMIKSGSAWDKRPDQMLRKEAGVQCARIIVPGALQGMHSQEEMDGAA